MIEQSVVVPYDRVTDTLYINAVGENETEAAVNLDLCENSDEVLLRMEFLQAKLLVDVSKEDGGDWDDHMKLKMRKAMQGTP